MARTWLITGASRGFGRHLAEAVLECRGPSGGHGATPRATRRPGCRYGDRIQAVALDVTDAAGAAEAAVKDSR